MAVSDYLTTPGQNNTISGINIAENCSPAGLNDAIRQLMADIRKFANDGNWFAFGTGAGSASGNFTRLDSLRVQFAGSTMAAYYYPGRRVRANMTSGTILAGTITAFSYSGNNNIITVNWDSPMPAQDIDFLELGMASSSLGFADPTASYQAATKNYTDNLVSQSSSQLTTKINSIVPAGSVFYFATTTIPNGYLRADGALVSRSSYSNLYAAIGTRFGTGDG
ncbi:MAG: phage tail protein, partial [Alphaproteobacteria bacterium]|nr:phage tail protein [Alphaproteobacteria bacterium]